jgi:hypothetical protein
MAWSAPWCLGRIGTSVAALSLASLLVDAGVRSTLYREMM